MLCRMLSGLTLALLSLSALADAPVLRISTSEYPPFEYVEYGELQGRDVDTVRQVVERMGFTPRFVVLPWARAESQARRGETDMVFSLTRSSQRERYYHFTAPISQARDVFFAREDAGLRWATLDDLEKLRLGITASYSYDPEFMAWLDSADVNVVEISQEAPELVGLRLVAFERIDLFICEQSVCNYLLDKHGSAYPELDVVKPLSGAVGEIRPFRAAFSRQNPEGRALRDRFNEALAEVRAEAAE